MGPYVARCLSCFHYANTLCQVKGLFLWKLTGFYFSNAIYQTFSVKKNLLKRALEVHKTQNIPVPVAVRLNGYQITNRSFCKWISLQRRGRRTTPVAKCCIAWNTKADMFLFLFLYRPSPRACVFVDSASRIGVECPRMDFWDQLPSFLWKHSSSNLVLQDNNVSQTELFV